MALEYILLETADAQAIILEDGSGGLVLDSAAPPPPAPTNVYRINSGGGATSTVLTDQFFTGGGAYDSAVAQDISGITNPLDQAVYQTIRYGTGELYRFTGLMANGAYTVRLHFNADDVVGGTVMTITANGTAIVTAYDPTAVSGAKDKASASGYVAVTASSTGEIVFIFTNAGSANAPSVAGIEILR